MFTASDDVFYKQFFDADEARALRGQLPEPASRGDSLSTGERAHTDIDLATPEWCELVDRPLRLSGRLFPALRLDRHARVYTQRYGGVRRIATAHTTATAPTHSSCT